MMGDFDGFLNFVICLHNSIEIIRENQRFIEIVYSKPAT
jgi:hypothetical protein